MKSKRKILVIITFLTLLALSIIFWGTLVGGTAILILMLSSQMFIFGSYANSDLSETFNENGKNVEGWRD